MGKSAGSDIPTPRARRYERRSWDPLSPLLRRPSGAMRRHPSSAGARPLARRHSTSLDESEGLEKSVPPMEKTASSTGRRGRSSSLSNAVGVAATKLQSSSMGRRQRSSLGTPGGVDDAKGRKHAEMIERFQIRRLSMPLSTSSRGYSGGSNRHVTGDQVMHADRKDSMMSSVDDGGPHSVVSDKTTATTGFARRELPSSVDPDPAFAVFTPPTHNRVPKPSDSKRSSRFSWRRWFKKWRTILTRIGQLREPIVPGSGLFVLRQLLLLLAFAAHVAIFPLEVAFSQTHGAGRVAKLEVAIETVFIADFFLTFNTAVYNKRGMLVTTRMEIAKRYLRGWFLPDLLSSLPVDTITFMQTSKHPGVPWAAIGFDILIRSQRFIHVVRVARLTSAVYLQGSESSVFAWLQFSRYSHLFRIAWIIMLIVIIAHYLACGWKLLEVSSPSGTPLEQYMDKFYDALQLLQGQGVETVTVGQNVFAAISVLLGSIALAIVFSHVAILVSNFNANSTSYQRKMESVFAIMSKLQLPGPLRERIHQYYEHLWREYESLDGEIIKFSKGLSHTLELEVVLYKYMDLVMHVPFWRDSSPDFQKQLMLHLQVRVYLPDDYIIRRGEVGDEFYMINRGVCELVVGPDSCECSNEPIQDVNQSNSEYSSGANDPFDASVHDPRFAATGSPLPSRDLYTLPSSAQLVPPDVSVLAHRLRRGQSFGEMALLINYERTSTARALTYVEMCCLRRCDFQAILVKYPKDRQTVLAAMFTKTMQHHELNGATCPLKATVRSVFAGEDMGNGGEYISAAHAALLISSAVNTQRDDESIKFGVGSQLRNQLIRLRDGGFEVPSANSTSRLSTPTTGREESKQTSSTRIRPVPSPPAVTVEPVLNDYCMKNAASADSLQEQFNQLQTTQQQILMALREMRRDMVGVHETHIQLQHLVTSLSAELLPRRNPRRASTAETSAAPSVPMEHARLRSSQPLPASHIRVPGMVEDVAATPPTPTLPDSQSRPGAHEGRLSGRSPTSPPDRRQSISLPHNNGLGDLRGSKESTSQSMMTPSRDPKLQQQRKTLNSIMALISTHGLTTSSPAMTTPSRTPFTDQLFRPRPNNEQASAADDTESHTNSLPGQLQLPHVSTRAR